MNRKIEQLILLVQHIDEDDLDRIIYECNTTDEVIMAIKAQLESEYGEV